MKNNIIILFLFLILNINFLYSSNPFIDDTVKVKIIKIFDGDTYAFKYKKEIVKIRLLGADTYETNYNERLKKQSLKMNIKEKTAFNRGIKAKAFAEKKLLNKKVMLVRDRNEKNFDIYNRLLRYVIIENVRFDSLMILNKIYFIK